MSNSDGSSFQYSIDFSTLLQVDIEHPVSFCNFVPKIVLGTQNTYTQYDVKISDTKFNSGKVKFTHTV